MDERQRKLKETVVLIRHECRACFGPSFADKWGYWVDECMATSVHSFGYWVDYPKGDHVLEGHNGNVFAAVITQDGCYLFTGSSDSHIIKWDLRSNAMISQFKAHSDAVLALAHCPGILISASFDSRISVWDCDSCLLIRTLDGHTSAVWSVCLNKQGTMMVSGSYDNTCRVWSVNNGECLSVMKGHSDLVTSVLFTLDGLISASWDRSIVIWDPHSWKELSKFTDGIRGSITDISLNCDQSMLLCCFDGGFTLFQWPSMDMIRTVDTTSEYSCFHPCIPFILAVSDLNANSIRIYRTDTFHLIRSLHVSSNSLGCIKFSPDGYRLISPSDQNTVPLWDVSELNSIHFS